MIRHSVCAIRQVRSGSSSARDQLRPHKIVTDDLPTPFVVDAIGSSLNPG
jgi:hypothetical protein